MLRLLRVQRVRTLGIEKNENQKIAEVSMKKLFLTALTILTSGAAFALPVGNPADASLLCDGICWEGHCGDMCDPCLTWCDAFSVRFGFYGDYVFNRNLELDGHGDRDVQKTSLTTNAAYFAGNFYDRLDVFVTLGTTSLSLEGNTAIWATQGTAVANNQVAPDVFNIDTESAFSWSAGLRGTLWECGCTTVGAEFQYMQTNPNLNSGWTAIQYDNPNDISARYKEWQFGLGISYRINFLVPYAAVKVAGAKYDLGNVANPFVSLNSAGTANATNTVLFDLKSGNTWGYAFGVTLIDCEKMSLTGEARFGDERAFHFNGQIRF